MTRDAKGQPVALVVKADNTVEMRILETDRIVGDKWLVTKGIEAGDRVIVEGLQKTAPGAKVVPSEVTKDGKEGA